jgi:hypothetical protein
MTWPVTSDPDAIVFAGSMSCTDIDVAARVSGDGVLVEGDVVGVDFGEGVVGDAA